MNPKVTTPKGKCVVCGSVMLLSVWRHHEDNRFVHCNDCGSEVTELMHYKKQMERESEICITRIGRNMNGQPFIVYLKDGNKISVARDVTTKGPAWLEISQQAIIKPMEKTT